MAECTILAYSSPVRRSSLVEYQVVEQRISSWLAEGMVRILLKEER